MELTEEHIEYFRRNVMTYDEEHEKVLNAIADAALKGMQQDEPPTKEAYDAACAALWYHRDRADKAEEKIQEMVTKAANRSLEGYRELAQQLAEAQNENEQLKAELRKPTKRRVGAYAVVDEKNYIVDLFNEPLYEHAKEFADDNDWTVVALTLPDSTDQTFHKPLKLIRECIDTLEQAANDAETNRRFHKHFHNMGDAAAAIQRRDKYWGVQTKLIAYLEN